MLIIFRHFLPLFISPIFRLTNPLRNRGFNTITPGQFEILIQKAIRKASNIKQIAVDLPDRCAFKEALEIKGLSKSAL